MPRSGQRRPSVFSPSGARRPWFLLESLESRRLLSVPSTDPIITPNVAAITADVGGWQGGGTASSAVTNPSPVATALTPSQLAAAYSFSLSSTSGGGETIAIVDAYNDPNIAADLAKFDSQYNLPAANLTVLNQYGQTSNLPRTDAGWSLEIALDVEWAHAAAPGAKIVLVEANSTSLSDLMTAVQTAAKQANVVSMSWGSSEFRGETAYDTPAYFANPNVTFVAASGDDGGAYGASWPAVSPYVVSVGGTTLSLTSTGTIRSETAWNSAGSRSSGYSGSTGGTSLYESVPSYQVASLGSGATKRATPDVAAVANPSTGLSVYDSVAGMGQTGWFQVGGTSASSPLWAGIIAAADQARVSAGKGQLSSTQTLNLLYSLARSSAYSSDFHDVTSGSNFVTTAKIGYDMVTGLGSPISSSLIAAASKFTATSSVANAATTVASNATTTTTTRAQTVAFSATTAAGAGSTSMQVFLSVGPVTTTNTSPLALAASAPTSASGATAAVPPARPAQSLPQSAPLLSLSASEPETVVPTLPETPSRPGLWLDPEVPREIGAVAPVLATRPIFPVPLWDAAVDSYLAEGVGIPAFELSPSHLLAENPATDEPPSPSTAALAGLAVAIWGTWEYRSRRSDRDPRRWSPARTLSAF